jgi:hypothetical protein
MTPDSGDADIEQTIRFATTDLLILAVPVLVEEGWVEDARRLEREFVERFGISEIALSSNQQADENSSGGDHHRRHLYPHDAFLRGHWRSKR